MATFELGHGQGDLRVVGVCQVVGVVLWALKVAAHPGKLGVQLGRESLGESVGIGRLGDGASRKTGHDSDVLRRDDRASGVDGHAGPQRVQVECCGQGWLVCSMAFTVGERSPHSRQYEKDFVFKKKKVGTDLDRDGVTGVGKGGRGERKP